MAIFATPKIIGIAEFSRGYVVETETDSTVSINKYTGKKGAIKVINITTLENNELFEMGYNDKQKLIAQIRKHTEGKTFVVREDLKEYFS